MIKKIRSVVIISYIYPFNKNPSKGIFIHQQAKYMAREIPRVDIITTKTEFDKNEELVDNVHIHRVSNHIDLNLESQKLPYLSGFLFSIGTIKKIFYLNRKINFTSIYKSIFYLYIRIIFPCILRHSKLIKICI